MAESSAILEEIDLSSAPSPEKVDELSQRHCLLKSRHERALEEAAEAGKPLNKSKEQLIILAEKFGSPHAEKSKILHGLEYELVATFGMSTALDNAAVLRFKE